MVDPLKDMGHECKSKEDGEGVGCSDARAKAPQRVGSGDGCALVWRHCKSWQPELLWPKSPERSNIKSEKNSLEPENNCVGPCSILNYFFSCTDILESCHCDNGAQHCPSVRALKVLEDDAKRLVVF